MSVFSNQWLKWTMQDQAGGGIPKSCSLTSPSQQWSVLSCLDMIVSHYRSTDQPNPTRSRPHGSFSNGWHGS